MATENDRSRYELKTNTLLPEPRGPEQQAKELEQLVKEIEMLRRSAPSAAEEQKALADEERLLAIPLSKEVEAPFRHVFSALNELQIPEDDRQRMIRNLRVRLGKQQDALNRQKPVR